MKQYPKTYENIFTSPRIIKKCKIERVSTDKEMTNIAYLNLFRKTLFDYEQILFDYWVKITWLMRRYCYDGKRRDGFGPYNNMFDGSFGVFMRYFVGYDNRFIIQNNYFTKVAGYFDDFFPDFDVNDPFKNEYEYPYKYISLECLVLVYQMPERLELLAEGDKKQMNCSKFQDYIINYIYCYNDEHEEEDEIYILKFSKTLSPYVKKMKKEYEGRNNKT